MCTLALTNTKDVTRLLSTTSTPPESLAADPDQTWFYEQLDERTFGILYSTALRIVRDNDIVQDVMMNVIVSGLEGITNLRDKNKFFLWIYSITLNEANKIYRKRSSKVTIMNFSDPLEAYVNSLPSADAWLSVDERLSIENAIEKLDPVSEQIITKVIKGHSLREIAEKMRLPYHTVWRKYRKAVEFIKKDLEVE